jgi:hypothetical protein
MPDTMAGISFPRIKYMEKQGIGEKAHSIKEMLQHGVPYTLKYKLFPQPASTGNLL